jgi:cytoskeleton protein RodZ
MNDQTSKKGEEASGPIGGEKLREARRANDISIRDIAKELHLDEPKVRALEENRFDVLGAPVFAKGHMRKYAELVGVPADDILSDYYQLNRSAGAPPIVGPKRDRPREFMPGPWIIAVLLIAVMAAAAFWWFSREDADAARPAVEPAMLAPFATRPNDSATAIEESADADAGQVAEPVVAEEEILPVPERALLITEPVTLDEGTSLLPQVRIELTYSGDCWTEVSDASGRRLFYDLGSAGRVVSIGGDAPLRLILGDGNNVSITVEGRDYPIPNSARSGRIARLTINLP